MVAPWDLVAAQLQVTLVATSLLDGHESVSPDDRIALYNPAKGGDPWMALAYLSLALQSDEPVSLTAARVEAARLRSSAA